MKTGPVSFNAEDGIDISATDFDALISYIEHSDDFCLIKNNDHQFVYMNHVCRHYHDLPTGYNVEGKIISELPTYLSDHQDIVHYADNKILSNRKDMNCTLTIKHGIRQDFTQLFMCNASSIIKNDETIEMIVRSRRIELFTMDHIINNRPTGPVQFGNPSDIFCDREFEIVFYLLQRLSAKEIAEKLFLSKRTVENHTLNIYDKVGISGANSRQQLIAWARDKGYDRYVPEKFLSSTPIQFIG